MILCVCPFYYFHFGRSFNFSAAIQKMVKGQEPRLIYFLGDLAVFCARNKSHSFWFSSSWVNWSARLERYSSSSAAMARAASSISKRRARFVLGPWESSRLVERNEIVGKLPLNEAVWMGRSIGKVGRAPLPHAPLGGVCWGDIVRTFVFRHLSLRMDVIILCATATRCLVPVLQNLTSART